MIWQVSCLVRCMVCETMAADQFWSRGWGLCLEGGLQWTGKQEKKLVDAVMFKQTHTQSDVLGRVVAYAFSVHGAFMPSLICPRTHSRL